MKITEAIEEFLNNRTKRGCGIHARKSYHSHLTMLSHWLTQNQVEHIEQITTEKLESYIEHLRALKRSGITIRQRAKAIRTFFRWIHKAKLLGEDPSREMTIPKKPRRLPKTLTHDQINALIKTNTTTRDRAIIFLLLDSGLRRAEIANLELDDVDLSRGMALVRHGKGNKQRWVIFAEKASDALKTWIQERKAPPDVKAVFTTKHDAPMQPGGIYKVVKRAARKAGIKASTHPLRHTFATNYIDQGGNIFDLKQLMGHENISTTLIYLNCSMESLRKKHHQLSFLDQLLDKSALEK